MARKIKILLVFLSISIFVCVKSLNNGFSDSNHRLNFNEKKSPTNVISETENNFSFKYDIYKPVELVANTALQVKIGLASWYNYRNGLYAASVHFEKGTVLRVTNLENGKYVDVVVDDYGPSRVKHPNRIIDLDRVAFRKIAYLTTGLVRVKISQLNTRIQVD